MAPTNAELRMAGLLVPAFALRHAGDLGIGDTRAVRDAIQFCARHGFGLLQVLPVQETVGDHSPYNPISSRALSPALLSLTPEEVPGLDAALLAAAAPRDWVEHLRAGRVRHGSVHALKVQILLIAHHVFMARTPAGDSRRREFAAFQEREREWLRPYSLFRLLVREYEGNPRWSDWRPQHQEVDAAETWLHSHPRRAQLEDLREGFEFVQWIAQRQWDGVRAAADAAGVQLMGEISFGVSRASVDVWAHRELFDREWNLGTRPLKFFDTTPDAERWGQNWGLPAYRWEAHRAGGFAWLRDRVRGTARYFHGCRIDHLRGYFRVYQFPWHGGAEHAQFAVLTEEEVRARTGGRMPRFLPGPDDEPASAGENDRQGRELLGVMREAAGDMFLVGEIMGRIPGYMMRALDDLAIGNLTFPQLELSSDPAVRSNHPFRPLSLATYANHDNAPLHALYTHLRSDSRGDGQRSLEALLNFAGWRDPPPAELDDALLAELQRALLATPCRWVVFMTSDLFGTAQRFNLPGSFGLETWNERLPLPLHEHETHPVFGPRLRTAVQLIVASGRRGIALKPANQATAV